MENVVLRKLAKEFFEQNNNPTENDLCEFLQKKQWEIYINYNKNKNKDMVIDRLNYLEYMICKIPEDLIDSILENFEEILYDDDESNHFNNCIDEAIDNYKEDLQQYILDE